MTLAEMLQKRKALVDQARALLDGAEKEKRALTEEEKTQYDRIYSEARDLGDKVKREQELREEERRMAELETEKKDAEKKAGNPADKKIVAFRNFLMTGEPAYMAEYRALANDTDASGGYLHAPEQFVSDLLKGLDDVVFVRKQATVIPVTKNDTLGVPTLDSDPSDPTWTTEIADIDEDSDMDFGKRTLTPLQLSKLIKVSMKLLRTSSIPVENLVTDRLAYKHGIAQENAFLNGSGSGEPMGVFTAADSGKGITTDRDVSTDNTETAITADGLISAKYSLKAQYRGSARWLFHRDAVEMISKLKDDDGQYLWRPSLVLGQPDTLLNLALDESEYAPNTFTTGLYVGILANWKYYWIAELQGFELQRLNELYAATSQIGFIGRGYVDAMPVLEEAFSRVALA